MEDKENDAKRILVEDQKYSSCFQLTVFNLQFAVLS